MKIRVTKVETHVLFGVYHSDNGTQNNDTLRGGLTTTYKWFLPDLAINVPSRGVWSQLVDFMSWVWPHSFWVECIKNKPNTVDSEKHSGSVQWTICQKGNRQLRTWLCHHLGRLK